MSLLREIYGIIQGDERMVEEEYNLELRINVEVKVSFLYLESTGVAWQRMDKTRVVRTNTAKRAPNMLMHHRHVLVPVCTISIMWNYHTNPYHPSETTS